MTENDEVILIDGQIPREFLRNYRMNMAIDDGDEFVIAELDSYLEEWLQRIDQCPFCGSDND